jgi:hypothetical protein
MRLKVHVGTDWTLRLFDATTGAEWIDPTTGAPAPRTLDRLKAGSGLDVPAPPKVERAAIPAGAAHHALGAGATGDAHEAILQHVVDRNPLAGETEALGRYLHATLFGDVLWEAIRGAVPKTERIDLVLAFDAADGALSRWPWEMMRDRDTFLAAQPQLSIVREVKRAADPLTAIARTPRVLFVVGTRIHDKQIKPAAEYLHLLRGLRAGNLFLETQLLVRATITSVQAAISDMKPDVVHFICHGVINTENTPCLELVDPLNENAVQATPADGLARMLRGRDGKEPLPRFVVLSACHTAAAETLTSVGELATPLAESLVRLGVPVVVGMAGSVADQACRLFTRQFYESVASGGDAAEATALGRQAAIAGGGTDPRNSVDWALPAIYVASGIGVPTLNVAQSDEERARLELWRKPVRSGTFSQLVFCGRLDVLERFDHLMAREDVQPSLSRRGGRGVIATLGLDVKFDGKIEDGDQFGRTFLLRELAERALLAGHVPLLVARSEPPKRRDQLLLAIEDAMGSIADRWAMDPPVLAHFRTIELVAKGQAPLPGVGAGFIASLSPAPPPGIYGRALRLDLLAFLNAVRAKFFPNDGASRCRLVLLLDDVHKMEGACDALLHELIDDPGVHVASEHIRTVLGWSSRGAALAEGEASKQQSTVGVIRTWFNRGPVESLVVGKFGDVDGDAEQFPAYSYYLLNYPVAQKSWSGLAIRPRHAEVKRFWRVLTKTVDGVPSRLEEGAGFIVETFLDEEEAGAEPLLRPADDEDRLRLARASTR